MTTALDQPSDALRIRDAGLRVTQSRLAVLQALRTHPHARAEQVYDAVHEALPSTSLQSVYNALTDFTRVNLVRRIEPAGHPGMFELRVEDNHHHLICTSCGAVEDVDCVTGEPPCMTPGHSHGYAVSVAEVTFWGLCPNCVASSTQPTP